MAHAQWVMASDRQSFWSRFCSLLSTVMLSRKTSCFVSALCEGCRGKRAAVLVLVLMFGLEIAVVVVVVVVFVAVACVVVNRC